jgi:iron complex transport system substrate-binding protein
MRTAPTLTAAALAALLLAGCSSGSAEPATAGDARTLTDAAGAELQLPRQVDRIACLTAICGDALAELDLQPVAYRDRLVVDDRFWGSGTDMVEITGAFGEENLEDVAAAEPDLVVGLLGAHDGLREGLDPIAPLLLVDPQDWQGSVDVLTLLGELTGREEQAQAAADAFTTALDDARAEAAARADAAGGRSTSMAVYGSVDGLAVDSDATPVGSVLAELGDYPWSGDLPGGHSAAVPVSLEEVVAVDPDVVLVQTFSFGGAEAVPLSEELAADPVWSTLTAVQQGRVVEVDAELWGTGRGTRTLTLVMEQALDLLYPTD